MLFRSRYVLVQRGYFLAILAVALGVIYLFTHWFSGVFKGHSQVGMGLSAKGGQPFGARAVS